MKENRDGFVVVRLTATDMVCMRLLSLKVVLHLWSLLKLSSTSFTSGFTNLSMARENQNHEIGELGLVSNEEDDEKIVRVSS